MSLKKKRPLKEWVFSLRETMRLNLSFIILVEGKNDKKALKSFGIDEDRIYTLSGTSFYDLAEKLEPLNKVVIMLMDLDKKGEDIFQKLIKIFDIYKIEYDTSFRDALKRYKVKYIEKLPKLLFLENMKNLNKN